MVPLAGTVQLEKLSNILCDFCCKAAYGTLMYLILNGVFCVSGPSSSIQWSITIDETGKIHSKYEGTPKQ